MAPSLLSGDFIFAFRPAGGFKIPLTSIKLGVHAPERNSLVVFTFPDQPHTNYVKRVIGLSGDKIQMKHGDLFLNDQPFEYRKSDQISQFAETNLWSEVSGDASHLITRKNTGPGEDFGPLIVPPDEIFVLGDFRDASDDSRYWGTVPLGRIEGRVLLIWMSLDWEKRWADMRLPSLRFNRLFSRVH